MANWTLIDGKTGATTVVSSLPVVADETSLYHIATDGRGNKYVGRSSGSSDVNSDSGKIWRLKPDGGLVKVADIFNFGLGLSSYSGIIRFECMCVSVDGTIYACTSNAIIKAIPSNGSNLLCGSSTANGIVSGVSGSSARFRKIGGVIASSSGTLYVTDSLAHRIYRITQAGQVDLIAGGGASGFQSGFANGVGRAALFDTPKGLAIDAADNVYVCDSGNHRIRKISQSGTVTTLAGSATSGSDDGQGASASFVSPSNIAMDPSGFIYVIDTISSSSMGLRTVDLDGTTSTERTFDATAGGSIIIDLAANVSVIATDAPESRQIDFLLSKDNNGINAIIKTDGSVWTWGSPGPGNLGDNAGAYRSSPVSVVGNHSFASIFAPKTFTFSYGKITPLKADGSAWNWGNNYTGVLGDGTTTDRSSPVCVIGNHSFAEFFCASNSKKFGLKADGSVWGWGYNSYGQIGDNTATNRSSPVSIAGNHSFVTLFANHRLTFGMKADGSLWGWGDNSQGKLGDNSADYRSSPVSVVGNHSFVKVNISINNTSIALKSDGTAWAWGNNYPGMLGDGTNDERSSPVSVVGGHSFADLVFARLAVLALKSDGTMWCWGGNYYGRLADGTTDHRSSPVSVIGNHSAAEIFTNGMAPAMRKYDGTAWVWGYNYWGTLGDGTTADRSSPVSVLGNHSFTKIRLGYKHMGGLKSNGQIWTWGLNSSGAGYLGDGTTTNRSSPVMIIGL